MLITIKKSAHADAIRTIRALLDKHGLGHRICTLEKETVIGLESNPDASIASALEQLEGVEKVTPIATPFKLVSLGFKPEKTVIEIKGVEIGGDRVILMAGPCAIESQ